MKTIAIAGATGFVGTALTLHLLDQGLKVKALSRDPSKWPIQHQNLEVVKGDILNASSVEQLLEGCEQAYYLVHGLAYSAANFEFYEAKSASVFAKSCNIKGIKKIIYLGGLGPQDELSTHLRSRQLVGEILGVSQSPTIEFRASIIVGPNSTSFEMIKALGHRLPIRPYVSWLEKKCQPIGLKDLIKYLTSALDTEIIGHQIIEIGGANIVSYGEIIDCLIEVEKLHRPKVLIPRLDQKKVLPLLDIIIPEYSKIGKKLFLSLEHETVVTNPAAKKIFPEIKPCALKNMIKEAAAESKTTYNAIWETDFWKEAIDSTLFNSKHGQEALIKTIISRAKSAKSGKESAFTKVKEFKNVIPKTIGKVIHGKTK